MNKDYICKNCGKEFIANVCKGAHRGKFCSLKCYWEYKTGKPHGKTRERPNYLISQGYKWVRVPMDYNGGIVKGLKGHKYLQEHRFVAEKMIGRRLRRGEIIHHLNFDKLDNRPENLIVFSSQSLHLKIERELARKYMREVVKGNQKEFIKKMLKEIT